MTAAEIKRLPTDVNGEWRYNAIAFNQDNVATANGVQFVIYWDLDKHAHIARRLLPDGDWDGHREMRTVNGNPFGGDVTADLHNDLVVALDDDGFLHMSGNMHNGPLTYAHSGSPYDEQAIFASGGMVGTDENSVTYPQFVYMPDGELLFFHRNGSSGSGDVFLDAYNKTTRTWSRRCKLLDGLASGESPYLHRLAVSRDGVLHLFVIWRETTDPVSNTDLSYMKSTDNGVTWKKANNTTYTLPVTHATIEVLIDSPQNSGLLNQCGADVDVAGRPHTAVQYTDGSGIIQYHHVWYDGTWHNDTVTAFGASDLVTRPTVACPDDGSTLVLYTGTVSGAEGLYAVDVTPGQTRQNFTLADFPIGYEATFDTRALRQRNELYILAVNSAKEGSASTNWNHIDNWARQYAAVLRYDCDQLPGFRAGNLPTPGLENVTGGSVAAATFTGSTYTGAAAPLLLNAGQDLLYRVTVTGRNVGAGALTVAVSETRTSDAVTTRLVAFAFSSTSDTTKTSAWIPLRNLTSGAGTLTVEAANLGSGGSGVITSGLVEVTRAALIPQSSIPSDVDVTGVTNTTSTFQAWLDSLPDGSTVDLTGALLRCDQTVTLTGRSLNVVGGTVFTDDPTGDGSTLAAPSDAARTRAHWRLTDDDSTFTGHTVRGPHPNGGTSADAYVAALEAQHGFDVLASRTVLTNCQVTDVYGDFIYQGGATVAAVYTPCTGVLVDGGYYHRNGRQGFSVTYGDDSIIRNTDVGDVRRAVVDLEPNFDGAGVDGFEFSGNTVGSHRLNFLSSGSSAEADVDDVHILNNTVSSEMQMDVGHETTVHHHNWTITGNTAVTAYGTGAPVSAAWRIRKTAGLTATGNTVALQAGRNMALVTTVYCTGVTVSGNTYTAGAAQWRDLNPNPGQVKRIRRVTVNGSPAVVDLAR